MIKAVIFDADGPLYYRTAEITRQKQALLGKFDYHGAIEDFEKLYDTEKFKGYTRTETVEQVFQHIFSALGLPLPPEDAARFVKAFHAIQQHVTPVSDAASTLRALKSQDYKTCVLTDSFYPAEEKRLWFKKLGMDSLIDHVISSYDVRSLKDAPQTYQACLDVLKVHANETLFVGHQEYEMTGARKSGIKSVAILPISPPNISADYTITSLSELPGLLQQIS